MRGRTAKSLRHTLLLALACLCSAAAPTREAKAQEQPAAEPSNPLAGTRRKVDEYGKIGHCDETARLDNFAIELLNEPDSNGYLLIYVGKNDMPSWTPAILQRAASYLVHTRGLDAGRIKVVNGGYRESRAVELWVVPEIFPPPEPSDTVEFKLDRTKAYQWDEDNFNVEFNPDDTEEVETEEAEAVEDEAVGETVAAAEPADAEAAEASEEAPEAETEEEAQWRRDREKYEIAFVSRGVIEDEPEEEAPKAEEAKGDEGAVSAGAEGAAEEDAAAEPEGPPTVGEIRITLWWNVEPLAEELKSAPDSRVCLV